MPAVAWGVDAASDVSIQTLKDQGATFICCYLAPYPAQSWKIRTPAEIKAYLDAGFQIVFNWESDGTPGNGFATGVDAAQQAQTLLNDRGCPDAPVTFTFADSQSPDLGLLDGAHDGAASVLGHDRCGGYGSYDVIRHLFDGNKIHYGWQTYAWSNGQWDSRAQLHQWKNTQTLDFDEAWALDFGQYPRPNGAVPPAPPAPVVGGSSVTDWSHPVRDYYQTDPNATLPADVCLGWGTTHAAHARDNAANALKAVQDVSSKIDALGNQYAAIKASYDAIQSSYASVSLDIAKIKKALNIDVSPSAAFAPAPSTPSHPSTLPLPLRGGI